MSIQIWEINDMEWWAGEGPAEAILEDYMRVTNVSREDATGDPDGLPEPLTGKAMDRLMFVEDDDSRKTFRTKLAELIAAGQKFPCFFAASDC